MHTGLPGPLEPVTAASYPSLQRYAMLSVQEHLQGAGVLSLLCEHTTNRPGLVSKAASLLSAWVTTFIPALC